MGRRRRREDDDRTWGMKATESLLWIFGPANILRNAPKPPRDEDLAKDAALRQAHERVVRPGGHAYLVERPD
ncbi:hypothetical protein [Isoptericola cucumis]|uniref:Uncharacterized protein n=1 Tax=Isoptericola cucumis TaxID=1776856 RepID=A0ABQ2B008_9MICO|nr:hypothetical protein [Isoptericola cucumis]GGI04602.1 hypothetical protein GCM10007368_01980 [Isoptericola cucumis]